VERAGGDPEAVRGEDVTRAAQAGDSEARAILTEHGWWLALGLANLANIFDTAVIVLGGGLISALGPVLGPVRRTFEEMTEGRQMRPPVKIVLAELGDRAGAIGAALIAREQDDRHASTT
jgi:glucokinase